MLKISKLTDYGLLATVFLAKKQGESASSREVSEFCHLPLPVVSKVLKRLHEGGIIQSYRGAGGGYALEAEPESISLAELIEVFEGPWELVECESYDDEGHAVCGIRQGCPSRSFMFGINRTIKNAFEMVTLGDLMRGGRPQFKVAPADQEPAESML
jgi:Rrf2 family protein